MVFSKNAFEDFDAKVKKAVEAINAMTKSMDDAEKEAKELKDAKEVLQNKSKKKVFSVDPYSVNIGASTVYSSTNYWADLYIENTNNPTYAEGGPISTGFPKSNCFDQPIKQEFGKPSNPWETKPDWNESFDDDFNHDLVKSITSIYSDSFAEPKSFLQGMSGKTGECYVFTKDMYKSKFGDQGKAYVWFAPYSSWFKVPYQMVVDQWNNYKKQSSPMDDGWGTPNFYIDTTSIKKITITDITNNGSKYYTGQNTTPKPIEIDYYPAAKNVSEFKVSKNSTKEYYKSIVKKQVIQKSKPSKPKEGTIWSTPVTDIWKLYTGGEWINLQPYDKELCKEILNEGKGPQKKPVVKNSSDSGLYFRGNCSNWHEVINPEKTVIESVNGKYKWFISAGSSEKEYGCGHDSKRIMPVFTVEEKDTIMKEIKAKQNGQFEATYYIQTGTGVNPNWHEIYAKQTITIGGRPFHHNSGNKTWYMCLTFDEMKFAKMFKNHLIGLYEASPWTIDAQNIFHDAFPVSKHGFAWYYDGTQQSAISKHEQMKEEILDNVQEIANKMAWQGDSGSPKKKQNKDLANPTVYSDYQSDEDTINNYMMAFDHIYDEVYSINQFKNKAASLHKFLMHDIKLAMLKKNKIKFAQLIDTMEKLQIKYQEAEQYYVVKNTHQGMYLKSVSKVQNLYHYHYDNDYGIPS